MRTEQIFVQSSNARKFVQILCKFAPLYAALAGFLLTRTSEHE
jgi:hypothetical protein